MTAAVTILTSMGGRAINKIVRRDADGITKSMAKNNGCYYDALSLDLDADNLKRRFDLLALAKLRARS